MVKEDIQTKYENTMWNEYMTMQNESIEEHGPDALLLYQNGTFFEIYEYNLINFKSGRCFETSQKIQDCTCGSLAVTLKSPLSPHSLMNPYMCGIPISAIEKWTKMLMQCGFKIIVADQFDIEGSKKKTRKVTHAVSKGTFYKDENCRGIMIVYIEMNKLNKYKLSDSLISCGASYMDTITSKCEFFEESSLLDQPKLAMNEFHKFKLKCNPREIIIYFSDLENEHENGFVNEVRKWFDEEVECKTSFPKVWRKTNYQVVMLNKVFNDNKKKGSLDPLVFCGLSKYRYATVSYVCLLHFCYNHNELLLMALQPPVYSNSKGRMYLPSNTVFHLNLLSNNQLEINPIHKKITSLFSIIDKTNTSLGKRFLKNTLISPFTDIETMKYYNLSIQELLSNTEVLDIVVSNTKRMIDIEKLQRKIVQHSITPFELNKLIECGYSPIIEIYNILKKTNILEKNRELFLKIEEIVIALKTLYTKTFYNDQMMVWKSHDFYPIFKNGVDTTLLEQYQNTILFHKHKIEEKLGGSVSLSIEGECQCIVVTATQALKLDYKTSKAKKKKLRVISEELEEAGTQILILKNKLMIETNILFLQFVKKINISFFEDMCDFVTQVDYICGGSICAKKNGYHQPKFEKDNISRCSITELRHPIIEKIINEPYVTNDYDLSEGLLMYGCNSTGKTSFIKAVGLNVILAQMGYYTACKMTLVPYLKIFTRLSGNDNMFRNESSFVLEMSEARLILKNIDKNSLVLGDELCRGTETDSATALTISIIIELLEHQTTFLLCTHMHSLASSKFLKEFIDSKRLRIKHLSLRRDEVDNFIIYDRLLKDGKCESVYGLEVARSLDMGESFLKRANEIRMSLRPELLTTKHSRYNKDVFMDKCHNCGSTENLHTHHLKEQHIADENNFIGNTPKDAVCNLLVSCMKCHVCTHKNNDLFKFECTSEGTKLMKI